MQILDKVSEFCEQNNIKYWIDCGTLLGAIRHKGYIPWDDDIDVGMLRPDFDRFMELFNEENDRYKFYSIENNDKFYFAYGKVLDTKTVLYEPDKSGTKLAINIDIFVYDNAPDDVKKINFMYNKRDFLRLLHNLRTKRIAYRKNFIMKIVSKVANLILHMFPENFFIRKLSQNSEKYCNVQTKRVGNFMGYARMSCDKDVFDDFIYAEFENKKYKIPIGYDKWLRAFYGEYMELPPVEKRTSHHKFEAYIE